MRNLWKPSTYKIGPYKAIQLTTKFRDLETIEYCLAGPGGEIWEDDTGGYKAVILSARRPGGGRNKHCIRFGADMLHVVVAELQVPTESSDQTPFANTFGRK